MLKPYQVGSSTEVPALLERAGMELEAAHRTVQIFLGNGTGGKDIAFYVPGYEGLDQNTAQELVVGKGAYKLKNRALMNNPGQVYVDVRNTINEIHDFPSLVGEFLTSFTTLGVGVGIALAPATHWLFNPYDAVDSIALGAVSGILAGGFMAACGTHRRRAISKELADTVRTYDMVLGSDAVDYLTSRAGILGNVPEDTPSRDSSEGDLEKSLNEGDVGGDPSPAMA